jgi:hypothetical protein
LGGGAVSRYPKGSGKCWSFKGGQWVFAVPGGDWRIEKRSPACFVLTRNGNLKPQCMCVADSLEGAQEAHRRLAGG